VIDKEEARRTANVRPTTTGPVDQHDAAELRDERDDGVDALILQRVVGGNADLSEDGGTGRKKVNNLPTIDKTAEADL
jgi:hypothetical protein